MRTPARCVRRDLHVSVSERSGGPEASARGGLGSDFRGSEFSADFGFLENTFKTLLENGGAHPSVFESVRNENKRNSDSYPRGGRDFSYRNINENPMFFFGPKIWKISARVFHRISIFFSTENSGNPENPV